MTPPKKAIHGKFIRGMYRCISHLT